jgi:hypothetical protein
MAYEASSFIKHWEFLALISLSIWTQHHGVGYLISQFPASQKHIVSHYKIHVLIFLGKKNLCLV